MRMRVTGILPLWLIASAAVADDRDGDLLDDADELALGTDPDNPDTDGGGRPDGYEVHFDDTDPLDDTDDTDDVDGDGLVDAYEVAIGTSPTTADTDGDGLSDGEEVLVHGSDPLATDTDGDQLSDGEEVLDHHSDPTATDSDGDGLGDCFEVYDYLTAPAMGDSDGDGTPDSQEIADATDPIGTTSWCDTAPVIATDAIEVSCTADGTYAVTVTATDDHSYVTSIYAHPAFPFEAPYDSVAVLNKDTETRLAAEYRFSGTVSLPGATCDDLVVVRFTAVNARGNSSRSAWWSDDPPPSPCSGDRFEGTETLDGSAQSITDVGDAYFSSLTSLGDADGDGVTAMAASDGETTMVLSHLPALPGGAVTGTSVSELTLTGQTCATVGAMADTGGGTYLLTGDWCAGDFEGSLDVRDAATGGVLATYTGASGGGMDMFGLALPELTDPGTGPLTSDLMGGDGLADLVVGAPRLNDWDGAVFLFAAPLSGGTADSADTVLDSGTDGGYSELGTSVTSGGDLNGDGFDDLVIGRTFFTNSYRPADVLVLDGPIPPGSYSARDLSVGRVYVDQSISFTSARPGGDLDNDGYGDLLVSDHAFADTDDRVAVFMGPIANDMELDAAATAIRGDGIGFGPSYRAGDLDGDRIPDLVVGVPEASTSGGTAAGEVGILYGPIPSGSVAMSAMDARLHGGHAYGYAGQGVVLVGDIVGDGGAYLLLTVDDGLALPLVP